MSGKNNIFTASSGRIRKEDDSIINIADVVDNLYNSETGMLNNAISTGRFYPEKNRKIISTSNGDKSILATDGYGNLNIRGAVTTDE